MIAYWNNVISRLPLEVSYSRSHGIRNYFRQFRMGGDKDTAHCSRLL